MDGTVVEQVEALPQAARAPSTIPGIQMMRGIAAFMVVVHHAWLAAEPAGGPTNPLQRAFLEVGAAGVDIFFVISGFIMIYVSRNQFGRTGAGVTFLTKRAMRIVPLYWVITTGLALVWLPGFLLRDEHLRGVDVVCSYLFIPCIQPHGPGLTTHPLLDQGWTLSYEWYFYLLFAAWLAVGSLRSLVIAAPLFFCAVIAVVSQSSLSGPFAGFLTDPIVFEFCFGLVIGLLYLRNVRVSAANAAVLIAASAAALLAGGDPDHDLRWVVWGVPAALIVFGMLRVRQPHSVPGRLLVWLGDASYSLYLCHSAVTMTFSHYLSEGGAALTVAAKWVDIAMMCGVSIVAGGLVHRLIERPVTDLFHGWYTRRARISSP